MRLFVDDDINRHIAFAKRYPGSFQTASLVVAQHELDQTPAYVSELWLDHDLGTSLVNGGFFDPASGDPVGTQVDTVMPLVDWLRSSSVPSRQLPIIIHSWNVPASVRIQQLLQAAGYVSVTVAPFTFNSTPEPL